MKTPRPEGERQQKSDVSIRRYVNVHAWLRKNYGSASICEQNGCIGNVKRYEWALKEGCTYDKNRDNFVQLCTPCHKEYDKLPRHLTGRTYTMSEKGRRNISFAHIGKPSWWMHKKVRCRKKGEEEWHYFNSIKEAINFTGAIRHSVAKVLLGKNTTTKGYFFELIKDEQQVSMEEKIKELSDIAEEHGSLVALKDMYDWAFEQGKKSVS